MAVAVLAIAFSVACASAFSQQAGRSRPAKRSEVDAVVDAWVQQSSRIKSLSATFVRTGKGLGTNEYRYELQWKDSGQAVLETVQVGRSNKTEEFERVIWTGKEIWQYLAPRKEIVVWDLRKAAEYEAFRESIKQSWARRLAGSRFDLIFSALADPREVEPLPFLIGMRENAARKRLKFELVGSPDPMRIALIATPLDQGLKASYDKVVITLEREHYLPTELVYHKGWNPRDAIHYRLLEIKLDPVIPESAFEPRRLKGWSIKSPDD
jgi:outer membrane lipoprotein-sorting protein